MHELEERLAQLNKAEDATARSINDSLQKLTTILKQQKVTREMMEEKKTKEIRSAESAINLEVNSKAEH